VADMMTGPAVATVVVRNEPRNRLTTFLRLILAIPWIVGVVLWGIAAIFAVIPAWFALLFTGRYPPALHDFVVRFVRFNFRTAAFLVLLVDPFPPFDGAEHPEYPAQLELGPAGASHDRLKVGLRILYLIPAYIIAVLLGYAMYFASIVSWAVILVLGRLPPLMQAAMLFCLSWAVRFTLLATLLTETYELRILEE
jgi:hypothetical protein